MKFSAVLLTSALTALVMAREFPVANCPSNLGSAWCAARGCPSLSKKIWGGRIGRILRGVLVHLECRTGNISGLILSRSLLGFFVGGLWSTFMLLKSMTELAAELNNLSVAIRNMTLQKRIIIIEQTLEHDEDIDASTKWSVAQDRVSAGMATDVVESMEKGLSELSADMYKEMWNDYHNASGMQQVADMQKGSLCFKQPPSSLQETTCRSKYLIHIADLESWLHKRRTRNKTCILDSESAR
ncbi:hypothetical protein HYFRA_00008991 [Hymenoscyphus fraxineus]|uniref:Uncharacterized protein n=1 Tax=Hymenoscyphus fraxineus TaxID=746836 RepID=A0A9N9PSR4_9HELO|nr:hypothetical protein HYFRA_00008991 [Hymenoscyphus fraxineus]